MNRFFFFLLYGLLLPFVVNCQSFTESNLPILLIDTKGQFIPDEPKIVATLKIIDRGVGKRNALTDKPTFTSKIGIEQRGSTSRQLFPKKPYGFEIRDSTGNNSVNAAILGMPAESEWVLNATYNDKTLLRETLTYDIFRKSSTYYSARFRYCEVVLNGEYQGIYIVFEKIKRDKNRVPISSIKATDVSGDALTGGYILKVDKTEGSPSRTWTSPYPAGTAKLPIQIDRPKPEDLPEAQFQYIKKYVTDFEDALRGPDFQDVDKGFRKFANEDSFVDYLILTEVCKNVDGYRLSAFFYKDRDSKGGKLTMGPIWDYNLTYGNANYCQGNPYQGWAYDFNRVCPTDGYQIPFWWDRLLQDKAFAKKVRLKYQALRQNVLKIDRITAYIDSSAAVLTESRQRNFSRWPVIGVYVWPNGYVGATYQAEVDYLKEWIRQRLLWLDGNIQYFGADITATDPVEPDLIIGPNPSGGTVTLRYRLTNPADVHLHLTDGQGKLLWQQQWPGQPVGIFQQTLGAGQLPNAPGVYFLKIGTGAQQAVKKIVRY